MRLDAGDFERLKRIQAYLAAKFPYADTTLSSVMRYALHHAAMNLPDQATQATHATQSIDAAIPPLTPTTDDARDE